MGQEAKGGELGTEDGRYGDAGVCAGLQMDQGRRPETEDGIHLCQT